MADSREEAVAIVYTNYRGETGPRRILPERVWFGTSEWHSTEQWFLDAVDLDKRELRSFAMVDIASWESATALATEAQAAGA